MIDTITFFAALSLGLIFDMLLFSAAGRMTLQRALLVVVTWVKAAWVIAYAAANWTPVGVAVAAVFAPGVGRLVGAGMSWALAKRRVKGMARRFLHG